MSPLSTPARPHCAPVHTGRMASCAGVVAAMTAHGLPMLVVRSGVSFRDLPNLVVTHAPSIFRFDAHAPPDFDRLIARTPAAETLPEIARQLVGALEDAH